MTPTYPAGEPLASHWSDTAADDSAEWQQLRVSRAANALINRGREE